MSGQVMHEGNQVCLETRRTLQWMQTERNAKKGRSGIESCVEGEGVVYSTMFLIYYAIRYNYIILY
jgi:hypothetical protein